MITLPNDIIPVIGSFLDEDDQKNLRLTSKHLYYPRNLLTTLKLTNGEIPDLRKYPYVRKLIISGFSGNLTIKNPQITELHCSGNKLTSIDCPSLTKLDCNRNKLTSISSTDFPLLTTLYCGGNQLTSISCP